MKLTHRQVCVSAIGTGLASSEQTALTHSSSPSLSKRTLAWVKMRLQTPTSSLLLPRKCYPFDLGPTFEYWFSPHSLLVRLVAGPSCDRFGPRVTFAGCLLIGAIPTALAGTISSATGLYVIRFFIGVLGGSFVPCQVWTTGFFDKNVVGTGNGLTGGWGNAGGGITVGISNVEQGAPLTTSSTSLCPQSSTPSSSPEA